MGFFGPTGGGGSGPALTSPWRFDTATAMADPGARDLRLNDGTFAGTTALAISDTNDNNGDVGNLLSLLNAGDSIYIQETGNAANFAVYNVTAPATDNGTWHQLAVSHQTSGGVLWGNNTPLTVIAIYGDPGGVSGQILYTNVVTNDTELAAALTSNLGDTFIRAGSYSIDTDTLGALNTEPRTFTGAGISDQTSPFTPGNGVNILFEGAGGAHTSLDFGAGLTEANGVTFKNLNLVSDTAALTGFLAGVYAAENVHMDGATLTAVGIADSTNIKGCSYVNPPAGGIGFFGCTKVSHCTVGDKTTGGAETGFFICEQLVDCCVYYEAGVIGAFISAYQFCSMLSNCRADFIDVTGSGAGVVAFNGCTQLSDCIAIGPSVGSLGTINGFDACVDLSNCSAARFNINFDGCGGLVNCKSEQGVALATGASGHFDTCERMGGCHADGTGDPAAIDLFDTCDEVSGCVALNATGNGFTNCDQISSSRATGSTLNGFVNCQRIAASQAQSNTLDGFLSCSSVSASYSVSNGGIGFSLCSLIVGCFAEGNTGVGFGSNSNCSSLAGVANVAGLTDVGNLVFDPVTCPAFP